MTSVLMLMLLGTDAIAMRCDNSLVAAGANKLEVLSKCGEPDYRERVSGANNPGEEVWIYSDPDGGAQSLLHFVGVDLKRVQKTGVSQWARERTGAFRCNEQLITVGATKLDVRTQCGEPAIVEQVSGSDDVLREIWLYQQPDQLVTQLEFEGVALVSVTTRR